MTRKQQQFCNEYLIDSNARKAAIRAGYAPNSAAGTGSRILDLPEAIRYLDEKRKERDHAARVSKEYIIEVLQEIIHRSMLAVPLTKFNYRTRAFEQVVHISGDTESPVYTFDCTGVIRAVELLGRHLGFFDAQPLAESEQANVTRKPAEVEMFDVRTIYPDYDPLSHCVNKEAVLERYRRTGKDPESMYQFPKSSFPLPPSAWERIEKEKKGSHL